jgi:hypothetical protein
MPGFFISTPPRCGTHLLVDSIAFATQSHSARFTKYDQDFWNHPTVKNRSNAVIGIHAHTDNEELNNFAKEKKILTTERHPLGQALSILFMYNRGFKPDWPENDSFDVNKFIGMAPNSEDFLKYLNSKQFLRYRKIAKEWGKHGETFSFDKLILGNVSELQRLEDYVGAKVVLKDIEKSKKKYNDGIVFLGDADLWRTIITQEIADEASKLFPEYDMETYKPSPADGNWTFEQLMI